MRVANVRLRPIDGNEFTVRLRDQDIDLIGLEVDLTFARIQPQIDVRQLCAQLRHPAKDEASCKCHGRV